MFFLNLVSDVGLFSGTVLGAWWAHLLCFPKGSALRSGKKEQASSSDVKGILKWNP